MMGIWKIFKEDCKEINATFVKNNRLLTPQEFKSLLPLACEWAEEQEKIILKYGTELNADQQIDAFRIGIKSPPAVRLMMVDVVPVPELPVLKKAVEDIGLLTDGTIGVTFRYGIYIKRGHWNKRSLIVHELTHTMQYERLGGFQPFLEQYLYECLTFGYLNSSLEEEARRMEVEIK